MGQYGTDYLESEAILAAQEGREEDVQDILQKMLPNELQTLAGASDWLGYLIRERLRKGLNDEVLKEDSNAG